MDKLDSCGTTSDSGTAAVPRAQSAHTVVPKLPRDVDGTQLSPVQKEKIRENSKRKMQYLESEYWKVRNGRQDYMRCPYCVKGKHGRRRNFIDGPICCVLFAKAFGAILDRQNKVDEAQKHAQNIVNLGMMGRHN